MTKEQRFCDLCGSEIRRDSGAWAGGKYTMDQSRYGLNSVYSTTEKYDVCIPCIAKIEKFVEELKK